MPTLHEAADTFARDMTTMNIAGLMMAFTPEGMMKAMAMQGQMQARAVELAASGKTPAPTTGYLIDVKGPDGDDQLVHLNLQSADGSAEIMTKWREVDGLWKVTDLGLVGLRNADGTAAPLPGS
jgi:hypothetical protein